MPEAFNRQIFAALKQYDAIFDPAVITSIETTTGAPYDLFAIDDTTSTATIVGEGVADTEQDPSTFKVTLLQAPEWDTGVVKVSFVLLQDAGINIDSMLASAFGVHLARGITPSLITALLAGAKQGATAVGDLNTTGATGITSIGYQDLVALMKSVDPAYRASAKVYWLMNDDTLTALDSLTDKQGHPIIPQTYVNGQRTLLGFPVGICPSLPDVGAGSTPIVFGATGFFAFRKVIGGGVLIRLAERYVDLLEVGFKSHLRANGAVLCAGGADSPVKYLKNAA
jgi:HK97 family phage major capsid protein